MIEKMYEYAIVATGNTNESIAEYLSRIRKGHASDISFTDNR